MKQSITKKRLLVSLVVVLPLSALLAHIFSTANRAERAAGRLADDICVFREQNAQWPNALSDLPDSVSTEYSGVSMRYDPKELTVTVPVSIVNKDQIKNLWSRITGRNQFSQTETTSISVYISGRYADRHPRLIRKAIVEGVPLNIDQLEKTEGTEPIGAR